MLRAADRALGWLTWTLQAGGALALAFMMLTIGYDALMRHFFARATSWSMEVNAFLLVYLALVTSAETLRRGEQIGIGFLAERCGPGLRRVLRIVIALVGAGFCFTLTWRGFLLAHDAWSFGERVSSAFGTPMWIPYSFIPLGFGPLGLQFLANALRDGPDEIAPL
ncbi:TRAP transporter small permease [Paracoccus sp. M683]|uniref:TRAP transporter small permease n=1 Tax=Paracoccus sp. M683 TaxID=2594268 RepID=UPI00117E0E64|nr:TRAP transporter small permease [Paracoccus sp. M683]TRW95304.1 TRAP transporter small permease [Paracoccus sp. M683]